ncbi:MAG: cytochrome c [Alphaproteobacteria bacterium]|nr:cytochrome c [Alphaproteobacteria bacterium]
MRDAVVNTLSMLLMLAAFGAQAAWADAASGRAIAQLWCAGCHVIGGKQTGTVPQGPPSFIAIAKSGLDTDQLRTFLAHPHGAMPDLALTRSEIDNLILYIQSLR